jgi:hypothetical protein
MIAPRHVHLSLNCKDTTHTVPHYVTVVILMVRPVLLVAVYVILSCGGSHAATETRPPQLRVWEGPKSGRE